ncbi:MAG TPA: TetR family transcriptional regulator [Streptosporangiaceae bacterium]|nr:TetR family transcriptional regulator [Streptosporangiaceae bacterium]
MTEPDPGTPPRLSRKEAKARTRELLLDAATRVFARKGYAGASVDDIAEAAGFTIGALYSNFSGKEDLFIELLSARSSTRMADALAIVGDSDAPIEQRRSRLADHLVEVAAQDADLAVLEAEFWLYAMRKPDFHERLTAQFRENRDSLAALLADWAQDQGRSGAIPFEGLSTILLALFQGLVKLRRTDPALVPDDLYATAIRWLFAGLTAEYGRDS